MISDKKISVVIPAFNIGGDIIDLINKIPEYVDKIYLIDDDCPLRTGKIAKQKLFNNTKLHILFNEKNTGVGGAVKKGYEKSLKDNIDIIVKIDGDNQMNPNEIIKLIDPLLKNFDYSKGNRFLDKKDIQNYPISRFYGNIFLSFISKLSSGYWDIFDPINGFTAITKECLQNLNLENIDNRYFFETDMLFNLYLKRGKVIDVPVEIKYFSGSIQNMNIFKESFNFFFKNIFRFVKRIRLVYFKNNFTIASFFASIFIISSIITMFYGGFNYFYHKNLDIFAPTGVVLLSSISLLITILSFMVFLILDALNNPNK